MNVRRLQEMQTLYKETRISYFEGDVKDCVFFLLS